MLEPEILKKLPPSIEKQENHIKKYCYGLIDRKAKPTKQKR
jgi:hypothetical protein